MSNVQSSSCLLLKRYGDLLSRATLRPDKRQREVVARLSHLLDELTKYGDGVSAYRKNLEEYQVQRSRLMSQVQQRRQEQSRDESSAKSSTRDSGVISWMWKLLGQSNQSAGQQGAAAGTAASGQLLQEAKEVEREVNEMMGAAPPPPLAPKGLYIHGSVGSGKTLLLDLFFSEAINIRTLEAARRMHFNAAMLEVHSRIHRLEMERSKAGEAGGAVAPHASAGESCAEDEHAGAEHYPVSLAAPTHRARAAVLAVRRHISAARAAKGSTDALAAANSQQLLTVSEEMMYGDDRRLKAGGKLVLPPRPAVMCFDEMQVSDVFSAVALKGLFEGITHLGGVPVFTSNREPLTLPRHGLHEAMWGHFIETLERSCEVIELSAEADYRRLLRTSFSSSPTNPPSKPTTEPTLSSTVPATVRQQGGASTSQGVDSESQCPVPTYICPLGPSSVAAVERAWEWLGGSQQDCVETIPVLFGRTLVLPRSTPRRAVRFTFTELCDSPLGPPDYIALANHVSALLLTDVPAMSLQSRDKARRFITLVDELYNARRLLVLSAAVPPDDLFTGHDNDEPILDASDLEGLQFETAVEGARLRRDVNQEGAVAPLLAGTGITEAAGRFGGVEERFAFARAISRLHEMQSPSYLAATVRSNTPSPVVALE